METQNFERALKNEIFRIIEEESGFPECIPKGKVLRKSIFGDVCFGKSYREKPYWNIRQ